MRAVGGRNALWRAPIQFGTDSSRKSIVTVVMKLPFWIVVVPLLLFSSFIVGSRIDASLISQEEMNTLKHFVSADGRLSIAETIKSQQIRSPEHVPAYYILLSFWSDLTGLHYVPLRTMSYLVYMLCLALTYGFCAKQFDGWHAFYATSFVALAGLNVYVGHSIRMYAMVVLLTLSVLWSYWHVAVSIRPNKIYSYLPLLILSVLSLYTHIVLLFVLFGVGIYHLFFAAKSRSWIVVTFVFILACLAFIPWLPKMLEASLGFEDLSATKQSSWDVIWNSIFLFSNGFWIGALALLGMLVWKFPKQNSNMRFIVVTFVAMAAAMLILNELIAYIPSRRMRYTLVWLPPLAIIFGYGVSLLHQWRRWASIAVLTIWICMFTWFLSSDELYSYSNLQSIRFREMIPLHRIGELLHTGYERFSGTFNNVLVFDSELKYRSHVFNYYSEIYGLRFMYASATMSNPYEFPGFWLAYRTADDEAFRAWFSQVEVAAAFGSFHECFRALDMPSVRLLYYLPVRFPCELLTADLPRWVKFSNGYNLRNYVVAIENDIMAVTLWWDNPKNVLDSRYATSVQLFIDEEKVAQADRHVNNVMTRIDVSTRDLLAKDYSVRLFLYSYDDIMNVGGTLADGTAFQHGVELIHLNLAPDVLFH